MKTNIRIIMTATVIAASGGLAYSQVDTASTVVIQAGQEAALAYNQGLTDVAQWNCDKAIANFTTAVDGAAKFDKAYYNRGVIELSSFDNAAAIRDFTETRALNNSNRLAQVGMGIALARQGKYDEAFKSIHRAETGGVTKSVMWYYYGYVNYLKGNYSQARYNYGEAIKLNPNSYRAYCDRATAHLKENNYKAALDDYTTAINLSPKSTFLYVMRADAKAAQGSYNLALQDINTAISIAGDDNYYELNARGVMYGRSGRYKKAMTDFNECIAKKPDCPDTYINIGNMLMLQKKYAEAEQQYTKAISLDPNNMAAYNNRGNAREMQFDLDGAESDFEMYNKLKQR